MKVCCLSFACMLILPVCWVAREVKAGVLDRDKKLREWQEEFNKVLARHNLFIKTRSKCVVTFVNGQRQRHVTHWIALAITAEECIALKNEPHLTGTADNTECCGGVDERKLCWHHR